jgi:hypothetical protein
MIDRKGMTKITIDEGALTLRLMLTLRLILRLTLQLTLRRRWKISVQRVGSYRRSAKMKGH